MTSSTPSTLPTPSPLSYLPLSPPTPPSSSPLLHPLPLSTRLLLRSTTLLSSLSLCLSELLDNALDASPTSISVSLSPSTLAFTVDDDGHGIPASFLPHIGHRHFTSKTPHTPPPHPLPPPHTLHPPPSHTYLGMRGEALASLATVATVDVWTSPIGGGGVTYHKRLAGEGGDAYEATPEAAASSMWGDGHGTRVMVRGLFACYPVRRRQLLLRVERERELVRRRVERLALVHPRVQFVLVDEDAGKVWRVAGRVKDVRAAFGELYRPDLAASLLLLSHTPSSPSSPLSSVTLHLSSLTSGYHTRDYQLLYINRRPITHLPLSRLIQQLWARAARLYTGGSLHTHGASTCLISTSGRAVYPNYVCELAMDDSVYDVLCEADKTVVWLDDEEGVLQQVRECIRVGLVHAYPLLQGHEAELFSFITPDDRRQRAVIESPLSASSDADDRGDSLLPTPPRSLPPSRAVIDLTAPGPTDSTTTAESTPARKGSLTSSPPSSTIDLIDDATAEVAGLMPATRSPHLPRRPSPALPLFLSTERIAPMPEPKSNRAKCSWAGGVGTSGERKVKRMIDLSARTPHVPMGGREKRARSEVEEEEAEELVVRPSISLAPARAESEEAIDLTHDALELEEKSSSSRLSPPVPSNPPRQVSGVSTLYHRWSAAHSCRPHPTTQLFGCHDISRLSPSHSLDSSSPAQLLCPPFSLSRSALPNFRVIGSVDCKFLLCLDPASALLIAVDQHAADERVRLEDLEENLHRLLQSHPLASPITLQLTPREAETLALHRQLVEGWGWRVQADAFAALSPLLLAVPAVLSSSLDPLDLQLYLAQLSSSFHTPTPRHLPVPLLHLLHSRACRTAIRFGDALSEGQRGGLIRALARCELPFQCAHGRPSMVPLVKLGQEKEKDGTGRGAGEDAEEGWKGEVRRRLRGIRLVREVQQDVSHGDAALGPPGRGDAVSVG